tara:strand:+ start:7328 stop:8347 length:1020 start_codon:yes stop_codon:yes gene_type:complete
MRVIAIDAGATKVSGGVVEKVNDTTFELVDPAVEIRYQEHPKFNLKFLPVPLDDQYSQTKIDKSEKQQGDVYIDCVLQVINSLTNDKPFHFGIAIAGIKDLANRGIKIMANGPRIPDFSNRIEANIKKAMPQLESDANMCLWGEEYAKDGALRHIENAYYLGGGTGTADGLKLKMNLIPFDNVSSWIGKAIELKISNGQSLERYSSMSGINHLRSSLTNEAIGVVLGGLLFERISTVYSGWKNQYIIDRDLQSTHDYYHTLLDRIVLGQQLSIFLRSNDGQNIYKSMRAELTKLCFSAEKQIKRHFIMNDNFKSDRLFFSNLREAPIIGMGAKVWMEKC